VVGFWIISFSGAESFVQSALSLPSVVATHLTSLAPRMPAGQRLTNTLSTALYMYAFHGHNRMADTYIRKVLPAGQDSLSLLRSVDVVLVNNNFLSTQPLLLPPNVESIGCTQCQPARRLPEDLADFMENSGDDGVVVFSLGITMYDPRYIPHEFIRVMVEAFGKLDQKVTARPGSLSATAESTA